MGGLGFRDFEDFNLALLAKQLWQLLHYPFSLLARVLKGRNFRYSSSIDERNVTSPSYRWQSIIAAKSLLKLDLRKTIGSGFNTKVWPTISIYVFQNINLYVNHMIYFNTKKW